MQHLYRLKLVSSMVRDKLVEFQQQKANMAEFYEQNPDLRVTAFDVVDTIGL